MTEKVPTWPMSLRVWQHEDLMDQMLTKLDIEPVAAVRLDAGAAFLHARAKCINCGYAHDCRNIIDDDRAALPPVFCSNIDFFARCLPSDQQPPCASPETPAE